MSVLRKKHRLGKNCDRSNRR